MVLKSFKSTRTSASSEVRVWRHTQMLSLTYSEELEHITLLLRRKLLHQNFASVLLPHQVDEFLVSTEMG